jgi:hypothetical protein
MANARRKFFDLAQADGSPAAARALRHIARLYRIEAKAQGCPAEVRERLRAKHAGPKPRLYLAWLFKARAQAPTAAAPPRRSTTRSTAGPLRRDRPPAHRQQPGRERHPPRRRGEKELAVHRLGAGRQTGCGDPELLGTAKLNGLDPAAWLKDTLEKLPAWPNSRIDELLPLKWDQKEG